MRGFRADTAAQQSGAPSKAAADAKHAGESTAILAGGCFWGVEMTFEHVRGVRSVTSGFARYRTADGSASAAPVEAVQIVYDPSVVTYRQLLEVFFAIAHDPTSRDRQGPDAGPEYRAIVYHDDAEQKATADAYVGELGASGRFQRPIVTEIQPLRRFVAAEAFHQDYGARHPNEPYIVQNDAPKLLALRQKFPALYVDRRAP